MWIVRRLAYAWSLTEKPSKWEGKQLSAHVSQMVGAYDQLGEIMYDWIHYDAHKEKEQAHNYVLAAVCEWLHPNFTGTQSEPLDDLQRMIKGITNPVPIEEVKDEGLAVAQPAPVDGALPDGGGTSTVVVPFSAPDPGPGPSADDLIFSAQEVQFTTCATHVFLILRVSFSFVGSSWGTVGSMDSLGA